MPAYRLSPDDFDDDFDEFDDDPDAPVDEDTAQAVKVALRALAESCIEAARLLAEFGNSATDAAFSGSTPTAGQVATFARTTPKLVELLKCIHASEDR